MNPAELTRNALRAIQGVSATITRGNVKSKPLIVILGRVDAVVTVDKNVRLESKAQEILIHAAEYKLAGVVSEPAANDRITVTIQGKPVDFDVRPIANHKCFDFSNPEGTELRVHTKRVTSGA